MVGRFTSVDPAKDGLNWYAYCNNNPVAYIDPSGKEPISLIIFGLAIFGFVFLTGCSDEPSTSNNTEHSPPEDYIQNNSARHNCYSYAFGLSRGADPGSFTKSMFLDKRAERMYDKKNAYSVEEISEFVIKDMKSLGKSVRIINSPSDKEVDEYIVALKTSDIVLEGIADYHFARQLSDGTWADKPGTYPSRWNEIDGTSELWDLGGLQYGTFYDDYYNSDTIYFAVKVDK